MKSPGLIPYRIYSSLILSLFFVFIGSTTYAEEEKPIGERCVILNRINSIKIVDKQHIEFKMKGKKTYVNTLPHKCVGLRKDSTILYRTSLPKLCDVDIITVVDGIGSHGLRPLGSCGLGRFVLKEEPETKKEKKK